MNKYRELKERQQKEFNEFPIFFAFSNEQFEEGMKKLGLKPKDTNKIYKLGNTGGFYRKADAPKLKELFDRNHKEMQEAIAGDKDGTGFIYDMFLYELGNHEYCITYDLEPTLDACGLTMEEVEKNPAMAKALKKATKDYMENVID